MMVRRIAILLGPKLRPLRSRLRAPSSTPPLTDAHKVAMPGNRKQGDDVIIVSSLKDETEFKQRFPSGNRSLQPYLRYTKQPGKI